MKLKNLVVKTAVLFCGFLLALGAEADQAMPYCFHLDGNLYNEGTAEASSYKLTKTGSGADSFSTTAQYGGQSLQGGASNSYILTAATPGEALVSNAGGWTLSLWVNYSGGSWMWRDVAGFSIGDKFYQIQRTNVDTYNIYGGSGSLSMEIPGKTASDWVNIVFVMAAGSDTSVKIYADGAEVGTYSAAASLAGAGAGGLTSISLGNQVLSAIAGDGTFSYYGRAQSGLIDEVAVYDFAANDEQIGWLAANAPSEELYGPIVQPEKTAYYRSGYVGDHQASVADALKLTESSGGATLEYNRTYGNWTIIIDENSPAGAQAWCADTVKYNGRTMKIVKIIVKRDFTLKPGVAATLFDGVEFEVVEGAKLTLTKEGSRNMSLGAVTFSGEGVVDAATGVAFTQDYIIKGNVQVEVAPGPSKKLVGAEVWTVTAEELTNLAQGFTLDLSAYRALDQAPVVLPEGTTAEAAETFLAKLRVVRPVIRTNASLAVKDNALVLAYAPMTLYWAAWRGTFWEHIGQTDVNGNHGLMRDVDGDTVAHRPNDTVVFDKEHYTDGDGQFAEQTAYWHYDENLYIKDEVVPGASNEWDLKILEGVTLKMGLRGARATGQNVITNLKIYVEAGSTLELGYWGNTHHYQGVIRDDVVFGGAGTILFGADLGPSLRAEGDIGVNGSDVPTMDLNGKELVLSGANSTNAVNLCGFGAITPTAAGIHLTGDVDFGDAATIDASNAANMLTLDAGVSFGSSLTVKLTAAPTEGHPVKVLALGADARVSLDQTDVRVLVGGKPVAALFALVEGADGLYVQVKPGPAISYTVTASEGYDFAGGLITVTMDPAVADLPISVTVGGATWTGTVGADGTGVVMVGDEDTLLDAGNYDYAISVGDNDYSGTGTLSVGDKWFEAKPTAEPVGGAWVTEPEVSDNAYQLSGESTFTVSDDKAAGEVGVIEQVVTFTSAADADALAEAVAQDGAKGAVTLAEVGGAAGEDAPRYGWKGLVGGEWVELSGVEATLGTHTIRVEYDRTESAAKMRYLVDGAAVSEWFAVEGGDSAPALESVSYIGNGTLSHLTGFVDDPALVEYAGVKYKSMEAAVAAWKAAGMSGAITLLTNIYFAPEPGTYAIAKNGFKLYLTNDMIITSENGTTVVVDFPPTVDRYTAGLEVVIDGETMAAPFIIDGEWLGHAIPWKRHSLIQAALTEIPDGADFARWQAYVLGFAADAVETAKAPAVFAVPNANPSTVTLGDGLTPRPARETGVVVTRKLVGSVSAPAREDTGGTMTEVETAYDEETGLPEFDLTTMEEKVQYLKISYEFEGDAGQKE